VRRGRGRGRDDSGFGCRGGVGALGRGRLGRFGCSAEAGARCARAAQMVRQARTRRQEEEDGCEGGARVEVSEKLRECV
jgi:hypothetical protein